MKEEEKLDVEEWKKDFKVKVWYALRDVYKSIFRASREILATEGKRERGEIIGELWMMEVLINQMIHEYSDTLYENYEINTEELLKEELETK